MTHAASDTTVFPLVSTSHFKSSFWSAMLAFDFHSSLATPGYDISSHGTAGPSVKRGYTTEVYLFHLRVSFGEPFVHVLVGAPLFRLSFLHLTPASHFVMRLLPAHAGGTPRVMLFITNPFGRASCTILYCDPPGRICLRSFSCVCVCFFTRRGSLSHMDGISSRSLEEGGHLRSKSWKI